MLEDCAVIASEHDDQGDLEKVVSRNILRKCGVLLGSFVEYWITFPIHSCSRGNKWWLIFLLHYHAFVDIVM